MSASATTITTVENAVSYLTRAQSERPETREVVDALLACEKACKKTKQSFDYSQLVGSWRLGFVSGVRKVVPAGPGKTPVKQPGKGRFLPTWISVSITYGDVPELLAPELQVAAQGEQRIGAVVNQVAWAGLRLQLSGPTRYWEKANILSFDFVHLCAQVGGLRLYNAPVRGGVKQAQTFAEQPLKEQAFFSFFAVTPTYLAARGKGGGLALWTRAESGETL